MIIKDLKFINYKLYLSLIYFFWIMSILTYFFLSGVKYGGDTLSYLGSAQDIINGNFSSIGYRSGFGLILLLVPFVYFKISLVFYVFFQVTLTALAGWCLYKISSKFFCKLSGIICVALFLLYLPLFFFNFYILTDTLFINMVIILSYLFVYFKKNYLPIIVLLVLALITIRPNGMMFLFSILICISLYLLNNKKYLYLLLFSLFLLILIFPIINIANNYIIDLNLLESISSKGIIWGYSFEKNAVCRQSCMSIELINENFENSIVGIFKFISINFINYFKIFLFKIFWLLLRARPYYSDLHNLYIIIFDIVLYSSFIYGYIKRPKNNFSVNVILFFILLSVVLVGLTFADWDSRFSLYFLPLIMLFSSYGILVFIKKIFNMINQKWDNYDQRL
jgi:hypothetical protein